MSTTFSQAELFDRFKRSFYIQAIDDGTPIPLTSTHHRGGVIVPVYGEWDRVNARAKELSSTYGREAKPQAITPFWDTLRRFAQLGFEGVMLDETHPVHFFNRVSEPDKELPSTARLRQLVADDEGHTKTVISQIYFGPGGILEEEEPTVPWADYSRIDRTSIRWMLGENPLPESVQPWTIDCGVTGDVGFMTGATLLGPYVSDMGAVPLFSGEQWAVYFGFVQGLLKIQDGQPIQRDGTEYQIRPVEGSIIDFLNEVYRRHGPLLDIGLNPRCHRYRQGYFFKTVEYGWCLRTLSGVFQIS